MQHTYYTYNDSLQLVRKTIPLPNQSIESNDLIVYSYSYDDEGRLILVQKKERDFIADEYRLYYNSQGLVEQKTRSGSFKESMRFVYTFYD